jgi:hypothetical protein
MYVATERKYQNRVDVAPNMKTQLSTITPKFRRNSRFLKLIQGKMKHDFSSVFAIIIVEPVNINNDSGKEIQK